ncbi:ATP-dependent (S)-NAD(P)H-hydrate dehydratase [Amanita muscaria]
MPVPRSILEQLKLLIPPLNGSLHKGQAGRVGVLGGARDYTGAAFFAAISALRFGVDLSHVICSPTAANVIKSYSPDLIVHPILREDLSPEKVETELVSLFNRLHVLVIGPGLGREPYMQAYAKTALLLARKHGLYLVLDADVLLLIGQDVSLIKGYRRAVLTPNVVEFKRLSEQLGVDSKTPVEKRADLVSKALGGVTVLQKGPNDLIAVNTLGDAASKLEEVDGIKERVQESVQVDTQGGLKRCGGQGDVLSGCVGAFLAWGRCYETGAFGDNAVPTSRIPFLSAIGGSMVTRTASRRAFSKQGRSLVTEDILPEIGNAFTSIFGEEQQHTLDKGRL